MRRPDERRSGNRWWMLLLVLAALLVMTPVAVVSLNEDEAGFEPSNLAVGTGSLPEEAPKTRPSIATGGHIGRD